MILPLWSTSWWLWNLVPQANVVLLHGYVLLYSLKSHVSQLFVVCPWRDVTATSQRMPLDVQAYVCSPIPHKLHKWLSSGAIHFDTLLGATTSSYMACCEFLAWLLCVCVLGLHRVFMQECHYGSSWDGRPVKFSMACDAKLVAALLEPGDRVSNP
jgi:hypothetical protein